VKIWHLWWNKVALGGFAAQRGFEVAYLDWDFGPRTLGFDVECDGFARAPPRSKLRWNCLGYLVGEKLKGDV
jgi:hypothetical protein